MDKVYKSILEEMLTELSTNKMHKYVDKATERLPDDIQDTHMDLDNRRLQRQSHRNVKNRIKGIKTANKKIKQKNDTKSSNAGWDRDRTRDYDDRGRDGWN